MHLKHLKKNITVPINNNTVPVNNNVVLTSNDMWYYSNKIESKALLHVFCHLNLIDVTKGQLYCKIHQ